MSGRTIRRIRPQRGARRSIRDVLYVASRPDKALIAIRQKSKLRDFFFCRLAEE
ncbi:hypothetical protein STM14_0224 [Salmonella enterica subsp. enterica serovar Typhimurium str. 14028S]|uniref:Uncharacterized protein n=1 Tax=Salmonella typhimurium (strain 14028s / SGSC 2262) TaxID=588858 RepID=A0A0F6AWY8_SALT1|nr:hypothetical protein STM14_0224 [Salmonella enterica subsp. enterica serovar Typhimurium str. 14028S]